MVSPDLLAWAPRHTSAALQVSQDGVHGHRCRSMLGQRQPHTALTAGDACMLTCCLPSCPVLYTT